MVQVAPATWNGFNDFADVCAECQVSRKFKTSAKPKKAPAGGVPASRGTRTVPAAGAKDAQPKSIHITHRRTGAVLQTVESHTLAQASLAEAVLSGADLQYAVLRGADLHQADLRLADLAGADLRGADLRGVNLRGADLRGTDLREARLYRADLNHAIYDARTRWPAGFDPRSCGAQKQALTG